MNPSSTSSTSVQNALGLNLSILELLLNSSGKMPQILLLPFGHSSGATAMGVDLAAALASSNAHHPAPDLLNNSANQLAHGTTPAHKRAKRTTGRVCGQCGTSSTVQWRKGPDGSTSLCNACGQRYHRRKAAEERQRSGRQQDLHKLRMADLVQHHHHHHHFQRPAASSPSASQQRVRLPHHEHTFTIDTSSLSLRQVKYEPMLSPVSCSSPRSPASGCASPTTAEVVEQSAAKRSDIYSLLN